jgi:hypothetical protein
MMRMMIAASREFMSIVRVSVSEGFEKTFIMLQCPHQQLPIAFLSKKEIIDNNEMKQVSSDEQGGRVRFGQ